MSKATPSILIEDNYRNHINYRHGPCGGLRTESTLVAGGAAKLNPEYRLVEGRSVDPDGVCHFGLHCAVFATILSPNEDSIGLVAPAPFQGIESRVLAGLDGGDGDRPVVVDLAPSGHLVVLLVEDDVDDVLLIVQAVLTILAAEEVLLDAPGTKVGVRSGWTGTGLDGADLGFQLLPEEGLLFDLLVA